MSPREGREFWKVVVRELERSKLTHTEFAEQHGLNVLTLRSWLYRLRREAGGVRLLPVRVAAESANPSPTLVEIGVAGAVVRAAVGTDIEYLAELVARLRERC